MAMGSRSINPVSDPPPREAPLVVVFSDRSYLPVLVNWLIAAKSAGVTNVRVYCLDVYTFQCVRQWGVDAEHVAWDGSMSGLWVLRMGVFWELLNANIEFVHSDIDAVWLLNPLNEPALARDANVAFSQGTIWPHDVYRRQGFVTCCGWFQARPGDDVKELFQEFSKDVAKTEDDQVTVNRVLESTGIQWEADPDAMYTLMFRDEPFRCWTKVLLGRIPGTDLTIALLPHRKFQRIPETSGSVYIKHFVSPSDVLAKLKTLREHDMLFLRADAPGAGSLSDLANPETWIRCGRLPGL